MFVALALIFAVSPFPDPWAGAEAPQVVTVSEGETVDLVALATPGQYTIVDVGAAWCAPCHDAARALRPYLEEHPDVVCELHRGLVDGVLQRLGAHGGVALMPFSEPDGCLLRLNS